MSDQEQVQFSEESTDLQGEDNGEVTNENNTPQGLTDVQLNQIRKIMREEGAMTKKEIAAETAKAVRAMQSMTDKKAAQIKNYAQAQLAKIEATGAQLTPDMKTSFVNGFVNDYADSLRDESPEPAQVQQPSEEYGAKVLDAALARVNSIARKAGVTIEAGENAELNKLFASVKDANSFDEFLDKAEVLIQSKTKSDKTPAQARIPSLAGSGGSSALSVESYKKEFMAHRGDRQAILTIQEKYRKGGVDVDQVKFSEVRK